MILVLLIWILIFFVFFVTGFSVIKAISSVTRQKDMSLTIQTDEFFFTGFLTISLVTGLLSIFIPIGNYVLYFISLLALILFLLNFRGILINIREAMRSVALLSRLELLLLSFLVFFILTAVVQKITLGDTESYHAQSIQWIKKYAVVPGLGNIHGRLAFNSMFFVVSGLFTFQIRNILIYPLNGICYLVLIIKLVTLYKKEYNPGTKWKAVFYILTLLISLLIMIPNLNSPSPDIICCILIIYAFILIMNLLEKERQINFVQIILLNLVVFSCIAYKISSLFLIVMLLFLLNKDILKRSFVSMLICILVISSFIIRNYYLSGYIIYPLPGFDIFNVDWKIPLETVSAMKLEIESWAKISTMPASEVINMKMSEWIIPWFRSLITIDKILVIINIFSIAILIVMLFKKDFFLAKIQLIILINLLFWFIEAPDPRFAYGFIFLGFSLTFSYIIKLFEFSAFSGILKYVKTGLIVFLILIIYTRIMFPVNSLRNPSLWILPSPFGTVETNNYYSDFQYRVPVPGGGCFNVDIPCVPYQLTNVISRGADLQDGFKVVKQIP